MATNHHSSSVDHHRNHRDHDGSTSSQVAIVMVPLPAQGHLNQLLHLSCLIAAYDIPIHYVSTATHIRQAKLRLHGWDPYAAANLHFHDFPIPKYQSPSLDPNATNKFPSHLQPLFNAAAAHLRQPLAALLHSLSHTTHRVVVIHDSLMSSVVQDVASIPNAESYIFHSVSAFSIFWYFFEDLKEPFPMDDELLQIQKELPCLEDCFTSEFMEFIISEQSYLGLSSGSLYNACRAVEGKFINLIEKMSENENKKHWAIGPFNPVKLIRKPDGARPDCLNWLDKQEPKSVIFVSFGTTTSLPNEQIKELANGLEQSEIKFIWVLREADRGEFTDQETEKSGNLPKGFEERVRERGIILRDWAPQLEILAHFATGGFLSHCGWNSCMESISMGVPVAAWPMHSDQPRNTVLMTKVLKIGVVVKDWAERDKIVAAPTIYRELKRLMGSEKGKEIRRRAEELGGAVRNAVAEGGVSRLEMGSFIAHIRRL